MTPRRHDNPRHRSLRCAAWGLSLLLLLPAAPAVGIDEPPQPSFEESLKRLTDQDWTIRQEAEDAIVGLGAAALPQLRAAIDAIDDVEVRERLRSALRRIGRDELMRPTLVTIDQTFARPADALEAIAKAAGLTIDHENEAALGFARADTPVSLSLREEPWIPALITTMNQTGINVRVEESRLVLSERPRTNAFEPVMHVLGAVAVRVDSIRQRRTLDLASGNAGAGTSLYFSVLIEPKLRLRNAVQVQVTKLRDDQDRDLLDPRVRRVPLNRIAMPTLFNGNVALVPLPDSKRIAAFEGELLMEVVTQSAPVRIDDLTSLPVPVSSVGGDVTVDALVKTADAWELQLRLPYARAGAARDPNEAMRLLTGDALRVLDQNARPMRLGPPETMGVDNGLLVRLPILAPEADARPTAIDWNVPRQTRQVRQPFKFADLPLPQAS